MYKNLTLTKKNLTSKIMFLNLSFQQLYKLIGLINFTLQIFFYTNKLT